MAIKFLLKMKSKIIPSTFYSFQKLQIQIYNKNLFLCLSKFKKLQIILSIFSFLHIKFSFDYVPLVLGACSRHALACNIDMGRAELGLSFGLQHQPYCSVDWPLPPFQLPLASAAPAQSRATLYLYFRTFNASLCFNFKERVKSRFEFVRGEVWWKFVREVQERGF